ncbi:MAG TPA: methyltransferase domain-containing protein [Rhodanobacteraceae bacterium]|nr:methyltransferase domain-containing protein [Rhodanobacteraceae bacterium]
MNTNAGTAPERQPHISDDLRSRQRKAMKIERLLDLAHRPQPLRMLEVGTGSGGIASYFGQHPTLACEVTAVDVRDIRVTTDGFRFERVEGTRLPFADGAFDVVISNHVIEHVGLAGDQKHHLAELRRVMADGGVGYLAVPNRWMLVEPHYRIAFLSWLPRRWRSRYLALRGKGTFYDCEPLTLAEIEGMLAETGFAYENIGVPAIRATLDIEGSRGLLGSVLRRVPDRALAMLAPAAPTLIYRLRKGR